jgi:hypothetical protein
LYELKNFEVLVIPNGIMPVQYFVKIVQRAEKLKGEQTHTPAFFLIEK